MNFLRRKKTGQKTRDAPGGMICLLPDEIIPAGYATLDQNGDVRLAVHIIADLVSNMTIKVMRNGEHGDDRIKDGLSQKLDIYPNSHMTRKTLIYNIVRELCLTGNAVVYPTVEGDFIKELIPIESSRVSYTLTGYKTYTVNIDGRVYDPNELLHFVFNPSRSNPFVGEGVAPQLSRVIKDQAQAQATASAFLRNKWKPTLIISTQSDSEELEEKEKRKKLLESYTSTTEIGEPWVIPAGEIDIKTVSPLSLKDLAVNESIELNKKMIAAAFGMPAFMLGIGEYKADAYNNFIATKILSFAKILEQELTRKLIAAPERYVEFNARTLMQYSLTEKVAYIDKMIALGLMSRNEARNELGLSPAEGDGMNDYQALENYIPVDRLGDQKKLNGGEKDE